MLPLFAMLLFALIGIGALVVDGGLALTEQARLETAAEMMVSELAYVESLPLTQLNPACVAGGTPRAACVEEFYLAPILEPLGVEFARGTDGAEWQRADRALDGASVDSRGARLGEIGVSTAPESVRLRRSSPLLFGWAALAPRTAEGSQPDFLGVQAARAAEGLSPDLAGSGLRGEGFALQAEARVDTAGGAPALRVGPSVDFSGAATGGLAGVAWRIDDLLRTADESELVQALAQTDASAGRFDVIGNDIRTSGGVVVGCLSASPSAVAHVGQEISVGSAVGAPSENIGAAYVPVVRNCVTGSRILGFLEIGVDASVSGNIFIGPATVARRNASATPYSAQEARDAGHVWNSDDRIALVESSVWRTHGLLVPRVESGALPEESGPSS